MILGLHVSFSHLQTGAFEGLCNPLCLLVVLKSNVKDGKVHKAPAMCGI